MASTSFARLGEQLWEAATALEIANGRMESFEHIVYLLCDDLDNNVPGGDLMRERVQRSLSALRTVSGSMVEETRGLDAQNHVVYGIAREAKAAADAEEKQRRDIDARR